MNHRNTGYSSRNNFLSKSYDNNLQDCDVASSTSSNFDESHEKSFDNLAEQMRGLKTSSKSQGNVWAQQQGNHAFREGDLTEQDVAQVEVFFRSHKTSVFVCRCLANLYFSRGSNQWQLMRTGVPVLILNEGETRARTERFLQIVLAEKGTGFVLWRDVINGRTNYRAQEAAFHVMFMSWERGRVAGLRFDLVSAAMEFFERMEKLMGDPRNMSLVSISTKNHKKQQLSSSKNKKKSEITHLPRKCDISQPCCFQHVTNLTIDEKGRLSVNPPFVQY